MLNIFALALELELCAESFFWQCNTYSKRLRYVRHMPLSAAISRLLVKGITFNQAAKKNYSFSIEKLNFLT